MHKENSGKRMRRGLVALAAVSILAGSVLVAVPATAAVSSFTVGDFSYESRDGAQATLVGYSNTTQTAVVIPQTVKYGSTTFTVDGINQGFIQKPAVRSITIPATVDSIGEMAFSGADNIVAVYFKGNAPTYASWMGGPTLGAFANVTVFVTSVATGFTLLNNKWNGYTVQRSYAESGSEAALAVTAGARTVSLAAIELGNQGVSHSEVTFDATSAALAVDDLSGSGAGWQVTLESTDFVWSQGDSAASPNADVSKNLFSVKAGSASVTEVAGSATNLTNISNVNSSSFGAGPIVAVTAPAASGEGSYSLPLLFSLAMPGNSRAGIYTATVTATMSIAPIVQLG